MRKAAILTSALSVALCAFQGVHAGEEPTDKYEGKTFMWGEPIANKDDLVERIQKEIASTDELNDELFDKNVPEYLELAESLAMALKDGYAIYDASSDEYEKAKSLYEQMKIAQKIFDDACSADKTVNSDELSENDKGSLYTMNNANLSPEDKQTLLNAKEQVPEMINKLKELLTKIEA